MTNYRPTSASGSRKSAGPALNASDVLKSLGLGTQIHHSELQKEFKVFFFILLH